MHCLRPAKQAPSLCSQAGGLSCREAQGTSITAAADSSLSLLPGSQQNLGCEKADQRLQAEAFHTVCSDPDEMSDESIIEYWVLLEPSWRRSLEHGVHEVAWL